MKTVQVRMRTGPEGISPGGLSSGAVLCGVLSRGHSSGHLSRLRVTWGIGPTPRIGVFRPGVLPGPHTDQCLEVSGALGVPPFLPAPFAPPPLCCLLSSGPPLTALVSAWSSSWLSFIPNRRRLLSPRASLLPGEKAWPLQAWPPPWRGCCWPRAALHPGPFGGSTALVLPASSGGRSLVHQGL